MFISRRGASSLAIFEGKLNGLGFRYLAKEQIPFIREKFRDYHRFQIDNAPTHINYKIFEYLHENNINYYKSQAQSPDLNPVELVWHDLKTYIGKEVKPQTKLDLINGILEFWNTKVTVY